MTKFDHGGDDDRLTTPPADPWLETAPTSPLDLGATADVRTSAGFAPADPTVIHHDDAPRRGRRGWWAALAVLAVVGCVGGLLLNPFEGDPDSGDKVLPSLTPTVAATTATTAAARPERRGGGPTAGKTAAEPAAGNPAAYVVTYTVTGGNAADVASVSFTDQDRDTIRKGEVSLPWRHTFRITDQKPPLVLQAQRAGIAGSITCTISVGGKVLTTDKERGRYAMALCAA